MTFGIGRGFAEVQILKKKERKLTIKPFADNLMLKRSIPRNCKMTFIIGRGFADFQILKQSENGPIS